MLIHDESKYQRFLPDDLTKSEYLMKDIQDLQKLSTDCLECMKTGLFFEQFSGGGPPYPPVGDDMISPPFVQWDDHSIPYQR